MPIPFSKSAGAGAVGGEYGLAVFRPGTGMVLQVRKIIVLNQTNGNITNAVRIAKAGSLTAAVLGGTGLSPLQGLVKSGSKTAEGKIASTWQAGTYANINTSAGENIAEVQLPTGESIVIPYDDQDPLFVRDDDDGGPGAGICVAQKNANQILGCTVIGREWTIAEWDAFQQRVYG